MRLFLFTLCVLFPVSAHAAACEGFNNAIVALEGAIQQTKAPVETDENGRPVPPTPTINQSITELEKALEQDHRNKLATSRLTRTQP